MPFAASAGRRLSPTIWCRSFAWTDALASLGGDASSGVSLHFLQNGEALEFGMAEIERLAGTSAGMGFAESFRSGPSLEVLLRAPYAVGSVEDVMVLFRTFKQVEDHESRHLLKMRLTRHPDLLEVALRSFVYLEPVHCDKHAVLLYPDPQNGPRLPLFCNEFSKPQQAHSQPAAI